MTPFSGLLFFYVMGLLLLPAVILGLMEKTLKYYGLVFTVAMLACTFSSGGQLAPLAAFYLWQTALCFGFLRLRRKTRWAMRAAVLLALLPLVVVKIGEALPSPGLFHLLGVSYMTFRSVQVLIDIHDGSVKELKLLEFSSFMLFFPSVPSGPIDRYQRFLGDLGRKPDRTEYIEMLRRGVWKLLSGAVSSIVLSGLLWQFWLEPLPLGGFLPTLSYMYGYTLYLFFNFAGFSSMAVGTAYVLGISLPENFRMPFLSVDMKDFWSRWHISLSTWLRDYLYTRFVMASLKAKRFRNRRTASYLGYLLNMALMGVWHGLTPAYLLYGAYHGVLMCANEALDLHWKPFRKLKKQGWAQAVLVLVTFHLFSFGLLIFSGRIL